jgi:hypothetical protein
LGLTGFAAHGFVDRYGYPCYTFRGFSDAGIPGGAAMTAQKAKGPGSFRQKEKFLFCFILLMGLILVLLITPYDSPEEQTHFQNVWAICHGQAYSGEY